MSDSANPTTPAATTPAATTPAATTPAATTPAATTPAATTPAATTPAATTPAATTPAATTPAATTPAATTPAAWWDAVEGLPQDIVDFHVGRNTPSLMEALKSGVNAHKFATERNVLPKPDPSNLSEWEGWQALGWTPDPANYKIASLKDKAPEGYVYNEALEAVFRNASHQLRIPPAMAQPLLDTVMGEAFKVYEAGIAELKRQDQEDMSRLRTEWGAKYDQNIDLARRASRFLSPDPAVVDQLAEAMGGSGNLMRFFAKIGDMLGEDRLVMSGDGGGTGSRSAATIRAELNVLQSDAENLQALNDPRHPRHAEVSARRQKLIEALAAESSKAA